jgi:homoserine O-succinyltransferase
MPLLLDAKPADAAAVELRSRNCIEIGLVNNMPDAALEATERQFVELIRAATTDSVVRLRLYSLPDVPRGDRGRQEIAARYRDVSELWNSHLDGLVVTGTEPRAADLKDEPYWPTLAKLVDWARDNTTSAVWSCLAAHAAVLHIDGIERRALAQKQFGIFDCKVTQAHPLTKGAGPRVRVPHSRCNDLPEAALASAGYRLLTRSAAAGVDAFTRAERGFFRAIRNTTATRCCANTGATLAASSAANATTIRPRRRAISMTPRPRPPTIFARGRRMSVVRACWPISRCAFSKPALKAPGIGPPSASIKIRCAILKRALSSGDKWRPPGGARGRRAGRASACVRRRTGRAEATTSFQPIVFISASGRDPRGKGIFTSPDRGDRLRSVALNSPILPFFGVRPLNGWPDDFTGVTPCQNRSVFPLLRTLS